MTKEYLQKCSDEQINELIDVTYSNLIYGDKDEQARIDHNMVREEAYKRWHGRKIVC